MEGRSSITGIILAGGKSSRLGVDKAALNFQGIRLIDRAIAVLSPLCDRILISANQEITGIKSAERIPDLVPGHGPMMGIYSCLMASYTKANLVLAVDNVFVNRVFFDYLYPKLGDQWAALPFIDNMFFEPLTGYYSKDILPEMKRFMEMDNYRLPDLLAQVPVLKLLVQKDFLAHHPDYFKSINLPEDLQFLQNI